MTTRSFDSSEIKIFAAHIAETRVARHPGGSAAAWRSSAVAAAKRSVSMRRRSGKYSMLFDEGWAG